MGKVVQGTDAYLLDPRQESILWFIDTANHTAIADKESDTIEPQARRQAWSPEGYLYPYFLGFREASSETFRSTNARIPEAD